MRCISAELDVTARNVTALVDGLEADGLVRRVPHPTDRRATVIELTPAGAGVGCKVLAPFHEKVAGLFRELTPADQRELLRLMESLLVSLQRRAAESGSCSEPGGSEG
jgi:DNA-binding MarR family transcriptional regulator